MKIYKIYDWSLSFPDNWVYEYDEEFDEFLFYPADSDLTIRITPFYAKRDNVPASFDVMKKAYLNSIPQNAVISKETDCELTDYKCTSFKEKYEENGSIIFHYGIGYYSIGELLSVNIFATDENECIQSFSLINKTIKKV